MNVHHRHNKAPRGARFALEAIWGGEVVGVCIVGRPVARMLDDGLTCEVIRRVIAKKAMASALGLKSEGGNAFMRTMSRDGIRSVASEKLIEKLEKPIFFKPLRGDLADGYDAEVLIEVCDAFIQARNEQKLALFHPYSRD